MDIAIGKGLHQPLCKASRTRLVLDGLFVENLNNEHSRPQDAF